jgi:SNF2 family DNA or RNA helicase
MASDWDTEALIEFIQSSVAPDVMEELFRVSAVPQDVARVGIRIALIVQSAISKNPDIHASQAPYGKLRNIAYQSILGHPYDPGLPSDNGDLNAEQLNTQPLPLSQSNLELFLEQQPKKVKRVQLLETNIVLSVATAPNSEQSFWTECLPSTVDDDGKLPAAEFRIDHVGPNAPRKDVKLTYRRLWKLLRDFRCDWKKTAAMDDEVLPPLGESEPSDISSTFERELEEEEEVNMEDISPEHVKAIIAECIEMYEALWHEHREARYRAQINERWHTLGSNYARYRECDIANAWVARLDSRLAKYIEVIGPTEGSKRQIEAGIRHQCRVLEPSVYQRQEYLLKAAVFGRDEPPAKVAEQTQRRRRAPSFHDSDPEGIDLDSDSDRAGFLEDDTTALKKPSSAPVQKLYSAPPNKPSSVPATEHSAKHSATLRRAAGVRRASISTSLVDLTISEAPREEDDDTVIADATDDVLPDAGHTPYKLKKIQKAKNEQAAAATKKNQSEAWRRAQNDEERIRQNAEALRCHGPGQVVVNPGKSDDESFVFINEKVAKGLRQHQIDGVRFMWREVTQGSAEGCIISHTMGLGKTLQAITLLITIQAASESHPTQVPADLKPLKVLILVPPSLIDNWRREFGKWLPRDDFLGPIHVIQSAMWGYRTDGEWEREKRARTLREWRDQSGVLILGHSLYRDMVNPGEKKKQPTDAAVKLNAEMRQLVLEVANIVIMDEAHSIKNRRTSFAQAVMELSCRRRIALSGSPISNSLDEYWSMVDWVAPEYLGSDREFNHRYIQPITNGSYNDSTADEKRLAKIRLKALEQVLDVKVHRREIDALDTELKSKHEFVIEFRTTDEQKRLYDQFLDIISTSYSGSENLRIVSIEKDLKLLVNHPRLFEQRFSELMKSTSRVAPRAQRDASAQKKAKTVKVNDGGYKREEIVKMDLMIKREKIAFDSRSWKVEMMELILNEAKKLEEKVLVFSFSLPTLDLLQRLVGGRFPCYRLDGSTPTATRQPMIDRFNDSAYTSVLLISAKAGGQGVNIQGANRVVIFDFSWSPAVEEQAIGRAYRWGQTKDVFVYRFLVAGSYESMLFERSMMKQRLTDRVVSKRNTEVAGIRVKDLLYKVKDTQLAGDEQLARLRGRDPILDKIMDRNAEARFITSINEREAFSKEDEYVLTATDQSEVDRMVEQERLGIRDVPRSSQTWGVARRTPQPGIASYHNMPGYIQPVQFGPMTYEDTLANLDAVSGLPTQPGPTAHQDTMGQPDTLGYGQLTPQPGPSLTAAPVADTVADEADLLHHTNSVPAVGLSDVNGDEDAVEEEWKKVWGFWPDLDPSNV